MATFMLSGDAPALKSLSISKKQNALATEQNNSFTALIAVRKKIDDLEKEKDFIQTQLIEAFRKFQVETVKTKYGKFTLVEGKKKIYGDEVKLAEEELKFLKEEQEEHGLVKYKETKPFIKIS